MSLPSVLVGNMFWTSLEEPELLKSGKGQLWLSSLILPVYLFSKTGGTTVGQIQPNSAETEISATNKRWDLTDALSEGKPAVEILTAFYRPGS